MANGVAALSETIEYFNAAVEEAFVHLKQEAGPCVDTETLQNEAEETVTQALVLARSLFSGGRAYSEELHKELLQCFTRRGITKETAKALVSSDILGF